LAPVVVDAEKVISALQWVIREMDARYHKFSKIGVRNISEYNKRNEDHMPYLVVVIDELADLMMLAPMRPSIASPVWRNSPGQPVFI
jgi:S-DNA-T family DNA segregation ATPase FtsK/SpoIIIE